MLRRFENRKAGERIIIDFDFGSKEKQKKPLKEGIL